MAYEKIDLETPQPSGKVGEPGPTAWAKTRRMFEELYGIWNLFTDTGKNALSAAAIRTSLLLRPGTDVQTQSAKLQSIADAATGVDKGLYFTSASEVSSYDLSPTTRSLSAKTNLPDWRSALGLGANDSPTLSSLELVAATPYVDFRYGSTTADYNCRLINDDDSTLTLLGTKSGGSTLKIAGGYACRSGVNGSFGNRFNINWTNGAAQLWVDATNVGTISLTSSDYRIKKNIKTVNDDFVSRINAYRVVSYQYRQQGAWKGATDTMQGLIAHEAKEANALAATGEKDEVDADGNAVIQNLNPFAIITDLIGAVQQQAVQISQLQADLAALKTSTSETGATT